MIRETKNLALSVIIYRLEQNTEVIWYLILSDGKSSECLHESVSLLRQLVALLLLLLTVKQKDPFILLK